MPETIFRGINDSIRITGNSQLTVTAGKDGIHAENDEDTSLGFVYISNGMIAVEAAKTEQKNPQIPGANFGETAVREAVARQETARLRAEPAAAVRAGMTVLPR